MKLGAWYFAAAIGAAGVIATPATAARSANTDANWPCQQVKVADLSVAAFWNGATVDTSAHNWRGDTQVSALVDLITQRRMPLEEAQQRVVDFAKSAGDHRTLRLLAVFTGVFEVLNGERGKVIEGLDRFGDRQKSLAASLRQEGEALRAAQVIVPPDDARVADLTKQILWDTQVFESRRTSLRFACDVPSIIEQRLYGISQTIQQQMN
jgi:hypothetical protein